MKLLWNKKDGGPESHVYMYGIESKRFGSVLLLRFEHGSREAYHSHAFNAVSWVLSGKLREYVRKTLQVNIYRPSLSPIRTARSNMHKVYSVGRTWVLSFRGPWVAHWQEINEHGLQTLTHGRKVANGK